MSIRIGDKIVANYTEEVVSATNQVEGKIRIATDNEITEGTSTNTAVTPKQLANAATKTQVDDITIEKDVNDVITAIGVKSKSGDIIYDWIGTKAEYEEAYNSGTIQPNWFCFITDDNEEDIRDSVGLSSLPYSINSCDVNELGEPNLLQSSIFVSKTYTTPDTYTIELEAGDYSIEMYGAGGGSYSWTYQKAYGTNGGGSGAGFKGTVTLPKGVYTLTVGATNATGDGGDTSINDLIVCGGGKRFTGGYNNFNTAAGGTISISPSLEIKETNLNSDGNAGYRQWFDGGGGWHYNEKEKGGLSLYDNSNTGYGAGRYTTSGKTGDGVNGYIKISSIGEQFTILDISNFTATSIRGISFERINTKSISVSNLSDATYNVFMGEAGDAVLLNNQYTVKKYAPDNPNMNDVWINNSVLPITGYKWNGEDWEDFDKNYLGSITVADALITKVSQPKLNDSILDIHIKETYINGRSGYRLWSDGWCEQWGQTEIDTGSNIVTFLKPFAKGNAYIHISFNRTALASTTSQVNIFTRGTTQQQVDFYSSAATGICWTARGYIS